MGFAILIALAVAGFIGFKWYQSKRESDAVAALPPPVKYPEPAPKGPKIPGDDTNGPRL